MGAAFFIETSKGEKDVLICKLAEYFCDHHQSAQIIKGSINRAKYLDRLLWIFNRESFVPHKILDRVSDQPIIEKIIVRSSAIYLPKFHNAIFEVLQRTEACHQWPFSQSHQIFLADPGVTSLGPKLPFLVGCHSLARSGLSTYRL